MGDVTNLRFGPGLVYYAPLGTAEPVTLTGALDVAYLPLGYTETGSEHDITNTFDEVEVAEELVPVAMVKTKQIITIKVIAMEVTARNLQLALNGGTVAAPTGGYVTFDPPAPSTTDTHVMVVWQADDNKERWLFRECLQVGSIVIPRHKGKDVAKVPIEFRALVPATGLKAFKPWFDASLAV
jgi:hypothetical protein